MNNDGQLVEFFVQIITFVQWSFPLTSNAYIFACCWSLFTFILFMTFQWFAGKFFATKLKKRNKESCNVNCIYGKSVGSVSLEYSWFHCRRVNFKNSMSSRDLIKIQIHFSIHFAMESSMILCIPSRNWLSSNTIA